MYRWNRRLFGAIVATLMTGAVKAEVCQQAIQEDLLCFTSIHDARPEPVRLSGGVSEWSGKEFWGSTVPHAPQRAIRIHSLSENGGITSRTDAWGKTTYYNQYGLSIGSSTTDITGHVQFRDQNGTEVNNLW